MKQPEVPSDILLGKLVELAVAVIDNLIIIVPAAVTAGGIFLVAWFSKRTKRLKNDVREAAVDAEKTFGPHSGPKKHAHAKAKLKKTWSSINTGLIDELIQTEGVTAAHEFRDSKVPPEPTN